MLTVIIGVMGRMSVVIIGAADPIQGIGNLHTDTYLLQCIDYERSAMRYDTVLTAAFLPDAVPEAPLIFKDPYTAGIRIYLNQAGKEKFEKLCADADLFGARFVEAGQGLI